MSGGTFYTLFEEFSLGKSIAPPPERKIAEADHGYFTIVSWASPFDRLKVRPIALCSTGLRGPSGATVRSLPHAEAGEG